jgi:O-antigen ligase
VFDKLTVMFKSLEVIRFGLLVMLAVILPFNFTTNFIVLPLLSLFLLIVANRTNFSFRIFRVSEKALWLCAIFLIHMLWFAPYIFKTWSFSYVEKALPFLLFPLMISSTPLEKEKIGVLVRFFIWAVLASYILSLVAAIYNYFYSVPRWGRASDFFFHEQFTKGLFRLHPTYYSLMGSLATLFAFYFFHKRIRYIIILVLSIFILLIDARITVVVQVLLVAWLFVKDLYAGITWRKVGIVTVALVLIGLGINMTSSIYDYPHRRLVVNLNTMWERSYALDINDGDGGIVVRMAIWRSAFEVIKHNYLAGVGLGNEKEYLVNEYNKNNISFLAENRFNAHNQLLSYLISMGLIGVLLLTSWWLPCLRDAIQGRSLKYFEFFAIIIVVGLTESLFTRVTGVAIFSFFNSLLVLKVLNNDK